MTGRRFFQIAGMTIQVEADLPITERTFYHKFRSFEVAGPGEDIIVIRHHFGLPDLKSVNMGEMVFSKPEVSIYKTTDGWIYLSTGYDLESNCLHQVSFVDSAHTKMEIYNDREDIFRNGDQPGLSFFPSDLIFLTRALADRQGCMLHSSGVNLDGKGFLFVGHSRAGKSTMVKMLQGTAEILCDDRIIVRKEKDGFRIHGTWNHGEVPIISPNSASLKAIMFLKKSTENRTEPMNDMTQLVSRLIAFTIKPLGTADWWEKTFSLIRDIIGTVPCLSLEFDKSGKVVDLLRTF